MLYNDLKKVLCENNVFECYMGWYIDGNDIIIHSHSDKVGFILQKIYDNHIECDIKIRNNGIIVKNVLNDIDVLIEKLNSFYEDRNYEDKIEFSRKNDVVFKFTYTYIEFKDNNISLVVDGAWEKEYETISIDELIKECLNICGVKIGNNIWV